VPARKPSRRAAGTASASAGSSPAGPLGGFHRAVGSPCTASILIAWFVTWVFVTWLGSLVVLADHAAEYLPPPDWEVQRSGGLGFLVGRALLAGLVGPVPVVMAGVLAEDRSQVPLVVDEHPVGALGSCCAYPLPGVTVRPRRLRRGLYYFQALACGDLVEDGRGLGVPVPDKEVEGLKELFPPLRSMTRLRTC